MRAWVLPVSATLHLLAVAALWPWAASGGGDTAEAPPIEVELVQQRDSTQGGAPSAAAASAPHPVAEPTPPNVEAAPLRPASPPAAASPAASPKVNLGDADETRDGIDVTGRNVVPPGPDSAYRNQPPRYPIEAARVGAEGTVSLVVHVSARGLPQEVVVANSSGTATLDQAARDAVRRWHFTPARIQGTPVPFDYALDIRFILGDRQ